MSISGCFSSVSRIRRSIVVAVGVLLIAPIVSAGTQLWLYPKDHGPRQGGHIVPPGTFTLVIENRGKPSEADNAQGVKLVVAVGDLASITSFSLADSIDGTPIELEPEGWVEGTPELLCSGKPMPPHGVYPATYAMAVLGDLAGGDRFEIDVTVEGGDDLRVHFDAMATGWKTTGRGQKCFDISNPAGHDVTVGKRPGGQDDCGRVRISKTADQRFVDLGDTVEFVIEVLNEGSCDLTDPILRDFVPTVEDDLGDSFPAFTMTDGTDPMPDDPVDPFLLEWTLESPLPAGGQDGVLLEVLFDESLADGQRVVNRVCISAAELRKPRCAAAVVIVGNPYGDDGPASPGFWCHAIRFVLEERRNAPVEREDLEEWLLEIDMGSDVFFDVYDVSTLEKARDLLCNPQSADGAADRLARHLLTLWLNVVSERLDPTLALGELCDGDEIMPDGVDPEMTVSELIEEVEEALLVEADDEELTFWSEVVDAVNNSLIPGEPGCTAARPTAGRHRAGHGRTGGKIILSEIGD